MLPVFLVVAQELDKNEGDYVRKAELVIKNLELTQRDSMVYGAQLLEFAEYCCKQGLFSFAAPIVSQASSHIQGQWSKTMTVKEKLESHPKLGFKGTMNLYFAMQELSLMIAANAEISRQLAIYWDFLGYFPENIETWYKNAFIYYKETGKADARGHIDAYACAARYYNKKNNWPYVEECYLKTFELQKKYKVLNTDEQIQLRNELALFYLQGSKLTEAENILFSLPRSKGVLANAVTLNTLANLAIRRRDYERAENLLQQAIKQYRASLPTISDMIKTTLPPKFMSGLIYSAFYYDVNGEKEKALQVYEVLNQLLYQTIKEYIPYMMYTDKSHLWLIMRDCFNAIQQFAITNSNLEGATGVLYENNQLKKNIFVNSPVELVDPKLPEGNAYLQRIDQKIDSLARNEIAYQTHRGSDFIAKFKNDLMEVAYQRDKLTYLRKKQWRKPFKGIGWRNVQAAMNPGDAVLEFLEIKDSPDKEKRYGVLLLTKHSEAPKFIALNTETRFRRALNTESRAARLRTPLWLPIEKELPTDVNSLFISPTGLINTISFAEIRSEGQYLCEKYDIHYLLNSEDIVLVNVEKGRDDHVQTPKNIYLFGGADYGLPPHVVSDVRSQGFGYLPGSRDEVNSISRTLDPIWKTYRFIGKDATEQNLRALSKKPGVSVLHISTHGFYLPYDSDILTKGINNNGKSGYFDPLVRTGFMLSGANYAWKDPTFVDMVNDCIVTAMDIGQMSFPYTELVVLSACNTGLGEIKDGEGVAGMQQALRMAGVRSMILSLNEVPDKETGELMAGFYQYWQEGYSKSDAFIRAQLDMKDKYPFNPKKWAGFILIQ